jgi:hypothetical protein
MKRTFLSILVFAAALLLNAPTQSAAEVLDSGTYHVYQGKRAIGAETFAFERRGDSLFVYSQVIETVPLPRGDLEFKKSMQLLLRAFDQGLILYESEQHFDGAKLNRGVTPRDTTLTLWRQENQSGTGDVIVRPPGKIFILDAQVFTLFDVISRDLISRAFRTKPIQLLVLGATDTLVQATATDLGTETLRWGQKPVQARKFKIADTTSEYYTWMAPHGVMIKMEQPATGLRVVRKHRLDGMQTSHPATETP